jgi:Kre9/KNH-like N-terminal Ig-like domain
MGHSNCGSSAETKDILMKKVLVTLSVAFLAVSLLGVWGCGDDDDPVEPPLENCSISVTTPSAGVHFQPGDPDHQTVAIRWSETGTAATVTIDLLKTDVFVGTIVSETDNDGYYSWTASNMGAANGADFSIQVTADGEDGCLGVSDLFAMTNTVGCGLDFTNVFDPPYDAGDILNLTWDSEFTTGKVDIQLLWGFDSHLGFIAEGIEDDGSFDWIVDSLHNGTASTYYLKIWDSNRQLACSSESETFRIVDTEVCVIEVLTPELNDILNVGDQVTISMLGSPEVSAVNLKLYTGAESLGIIKMGLDMTDPNFDWTVVDFGNSEVSNRYNIRAFSTEDEYCKGQSAYFTIIK